MSTDPTVPRRSFVEQVMGMPISIHLRGPGALGPGVEAAVARAFAELRDVEATFSTFIPGSEISRLDAGTLPLAEASPVVHEVIGLVEAARARTGGAFDARRRDVDGRLRYDPAGLVKGWAAERAFAHLRALPDVDAYLNAGGDVVVSCGAPGAAAWRIGIEDPLRADRVIAAVDLHDEALATSGTAHRGAHIADPLHGGRAVALLSVSVVGPSLLWADVLATAAFVHGADALAFVAEEEGYEALAVGLDGSARRTPGFRVVGEARRVDGIRRSTRAAAPPPATLTGNAVRLGPRA